MRNKSNIQRFALLGFGLLIFNACLKDDNDMGNPDEEQEVITTVQLEFTPAAGGSPLTFIYSDADGPGGQAPAIDTIRLSANTAYALSVGFIDNANPADPDIITDEVEAESDEHLVCYEVTAGVLTATVTDQDVNGKPLGLTATVQTGTAGMGSLAILLKHLPSKDSADPCSTGETDVEAEFPAMVN